MSWCDKLASTASVGFGLDFHFAPSEALLTAISPILDREVEGDKPTFAVEQQEPFNVVFNTFSGFKYGIEPSKAHVSFNHRMRPKAISGGPPIMEMLSRPLPYSDLLPVVSRKLTEIVLLLPSPKDRKVTRYGVVSTTPVDAEELPPGIARLIDYIGKPWGSLTDAFSIQITAEVSKGSGWRDRCVHTLLRTENPNDLMTIMFDFQRQYSNGRTIAEDSIEEITTTTEKAALRYFEELAEGNRFDEINVSGSVES
ncbi:MAG: hypothetical protein V4602_12010 [Pseudomonadota bacterium]